MKPCPKCGQPRTTRICENCAGAPIVARPSVPAVPPDPPRSQTQQAPLVCPKCYVQNSQTVAIGDQPVDLKCPACQAVFTIRVFAIRAKNSRVQGSGRSYSVRVRTVTGREELIEYTSNQGGNFELRSGDSAGFLYVDGQLRLVQNFTISQFMKVGGGGCIMILLALGATVGFGLWGLLRFFAGGRA